MAERLISGWGGRRGLSKDTMCTLLGFGYRCVCVLSLMLSKCLSSVINILSFVRIYQLPMRLLVYN